MTCFPTRTSHISIEAPDVLFLEGDPTAAQELTGTITLSLERCVDALHSLHIALVCRASVAGSACTELMRKGLAFSSSTSSEPFSAGVHTFSFTFEVSNRAAPSEKCQYGSVVYSLEATAGQLDRKGSGVQKACKELQVVSLTGAKDQPPEGVDISIQHDIDGLGHVIFGLWSPLCAVGGFLSSDLSLVGGHPPDTRLFDCDLQLVQHFELNPGASSKQLQQPKPETFTLFKIDYLRPEKSWSTSNSGHPDAGGSASEVSKVQVHKINGLVCFFFPTQSKESSKFLDVYRLAWHEQLRPSTLPLSETPIRVRHEIVLRMLYAVPSHKNPRRAVITHDITLASCASMQDSLVLPRYSEISGTAAETGGPPCKDRCVCSMRIDDIIRQQKGWVLWHSERMNEYILQAPGYMVGTGQHPSVQRVQHVPLPPKIDQAEVA